MNAVAIIKIFVFIILCFRCELNYCFLHILMLVVELHYFLIFLSIGQVSCIDFLRNFKPEDVTFPTYLDKHLSVFAWTGKIVFDGPASDLSAAVARDVYGADKEFSEAATSTSIEALEMSDRAILKTA